MLALFAVFVYASHATQSLVFLAVFVYSMHTMQLVALRVLRLAGNRALDSSVGCLLCVQ